MKSPTCFIHPNGGVPGWYIEPVFWLQGAASFLVWISYGVIQARRSGAIREKIASQPRGKRILYAVILLVGSLAALMASLLAIMSWNGFSGWSMTPWAWLAVTVLGVGFVHAQTMATAMMVTLAQEAVTRAQHEASTSE